MLQREGSWTYWFSKWSRGVTPDVFRKRSQNIQIGRDLPERQESIPATKYAVATGKEILTILGSAADLIPVPMLKQAIELAEKIIELCEEVSAVGQKIKELQDRVGRLMVIILVHVTDKNEGGDKEVVVDAGRLMEGDLQELLETLGTINNTLVEMKEQNRWLMVVYREPHMERLDECLNQIAAALERFKLANDLSDSDLLHHLDKRLQTLAVQIGDMSKNMGKVLSTVDRVEHKIDDFAQVMVKVKQSATSDAFSRQNMPLKPGVFYGRDRLVEDVVQSVMNQATSRVCILGPGGMGKTSVSLAVAQSPLVQTRFGDQCVWVPCIGATAASALLEILCVQLRVPGEKEITVKKVISELSSSADPRLLLFDNFETPWNAPGMQKQIEDILRQLAKLDHIAILMTMRGSYPPCGDSIAWQSRNIQPADEKACLQMYHAINPRSNDDPHLPELLHALGYMPFAVTLMASLGKEGRSTAQELLEAWSESGTDILSVNLEKSMNRSISLSVDSDLVRQDPNAMLLLCILSLLPAGTTKRNLSWWAPSLKTAMLHSTIATLSKAALLSENMQQGSHSSIFFVLPVVQSFMQQHGRIRDEVQKQMHSSCCRYVLAHQCRYDHPEFQARSRALAAEDANIQFILFGSSGFALNGPNSDISGTTLDALIAFCWYRCDTKPSRDLAERALAAAEASKTTQQIAVAKWCLGRTLFRVSEYSSAFEHLKQAYELFSAPGDLQWQRFGGKCGIDLVDSGCSVLENEQVIQLAYDVEARCATLSDPQIHGRSLLFIGFTLQEAGQGEEALKYLERAKIALEGVGSPLDNAEVYQAIGRVHHQERRISRALEVMEEAWKYAAMSNVPSIQGDISFDLGVILYSANRDADARKYIEKALVLLSQIGSISEVGVALEYMGYGYLRRGDYQDAHGAYKAAADNYIKCGWDTTLERCHSNLKNIMRKLSYPDEQIGFLRPFWEPDQSLLYL